MNDDDHQHLDAGDDAGANDDNEEDCDHDGDGHLDGV